MLSCSYAAAVASRCVISCGDGPQQGRVLANVRAAHLEPGSGAREQQTRDRLCDRWAGGGTLAASVCRCIDVRGGGAASGWKCSRQAQEEAIRSIGHSSPSSARRTLASFDYNVSRIDQEASENRGLRQQGSDDKAGSSHFGDARGRLSRLKSTT